MLHGCPSVPVSKTGLSQVHLSQVQLTGAHEPDQPDHDQVDGDDVVEQPGATKIRMPASREMIGVRPRWRFTGSSLVVARPRRQEHRRAAWQLAWHAVGLPCPGEASELAPDNSGGQPESDRRAALRFVCADSGRRRRSRGSPPRGRHAAFRVHRLPSERGRLDDLSPAEQAPT